MTLFHPVLRAIAVVTVLSLPAACATSSSPYTYNQETTLNPGEDAGLVIIGQAVQDKWIACQFQTVWIPVRPAAEPDVPPLRVWRTGCLKTWTGQTAEYTVMKVPPGQYYLAYTLLNGTHQKQTTVYHEHRVIKGFDALRTPQFTVSKGEILYVGEIVFDKFYPARVESIQRNDERASRALKEYVKTDVPITFRPALP
ncbi:hypothetical protein [Azospirillum argentinense]